MYGHVGRLTALSGGFRPEQSREGGFNCFCDGTQRNKKTVGREPRGGQGRPAAAVNLPGKGWYQPPPQCASWFACSAYRLPLHLYSHLHLHSFSHLCFYFYFHFYSHPQPPPRCSSWSGRRSIAPQRRPCSRSLLSRHLFFSLHPVSLPFPVMTRRAGP